MSSSPPPCSKAAATTAAPAKHCLCAPTTHPGSFRCRLHQSPPEAQAAAAAPSGADQEAKDAAAAAARALLERIARKRRRQGVSRAFQPGPSRLGATGTTTTTAMDD
ncbi:hypothetical protein BAE44_0015717 [Dichanthelium oligosanthes]|uniref:Uncharacterized protein n=1 Tax=Dichanthelium oligosanthes TaxID=888268 RepID=A0A1E5VE25_9POAL|nr:hypothetical protein BAE44_0015717 [Dichanthelium oligosanthes]